MTLNGGTTWRVNGPVFHIPAADAPQVVTQVGMTNGRTYYAWGGPFGGNVVNVTSDGGKSWYQTFLGGLVLSVVSGGPHKLVAVAESGDGGSMAATWLYVSRDGAGTGATRPGSADPGWAAARFATHPAI